MIEDELERRVRMDLAYYLARDLFEEMLGFYPWRWR